MSDRVRTVMIGFGRIAQGYASDPVMAQVMRYSSHAQVLREHPGFHWDAVIDIDPEALDLAESKWGIPMAVRFAKELPDRDKYELAVVTTMPGNRIDFLENFPRLRAVLVEKPLGLELRDSTSFLSYCMAKNLKVQVNLLRRADRLTNQLAGGKLAELTGAVQAVHGLYGNGLLNNGSHMIDLIRLFWGEIEFVQALPDPVPFEEGPLPGDFNCSFILKLFSGPLIVMRPVKFECFRENGFDIWGELGRLEYFHGGLTVRHCPVGVSRIKLNEKQVLIDQYSVLSSTLSTALYEMYSNLSDALRGGQDLCSPLDSALQTERVVDAVLSSSRSRGVTVFVEPTGSGP